MFESNRTNYEFLAFVKVLRKCTFFVYNPNEKLSKYASLIKSIENALLCGFYQLPHKKYVDKTF